MSRQRKLPPEHSELFQTPEEEFSERFERARKELHLGLRLHLARIKRRWFNPHCPKCAAKMNVLDEIVFSETEHGLQSKKRTFAPIELWSCSDCRIVEVRAKLLYKLPEQFCTSCFIFGCRYKMELLRDPTHTRPGKLKVSSVCGCGHCRKSWFCYLPLLKYNEVPDCYH